MLILQVSAHRGQQLLSKLFHILHFLGKSWLFPGKCPFSFHKQNTVFSIPSLPHRAQPQPKRWCHCRNKFNHRTQTSRPSQRKQINKQFKFNNETIKCSCVLRVALLSAVFLQEKAFPPSPGCPARPEGRRSARSIHPPTVPTRAARVTHGLSGTPSPDGGQGSPER